MGKPVDNLQAWLDAEIIRLRSLKMGDLKIAIELGQDVKRINTRRHELGLLNFTGNGSRGSTRVRKGPFRPSICKRHDELIRFMAAQGASSTDIAAACGMGVTRNAVIGWRYRNGIR